MGYVYILTNECLPGMVKIGYTEKSPAERAEELYSSSVPAPFSVYYAVQTAHCQVLETKMHRHYAGQRVNPNREFFNVTPEQAKATLDRMSRNVTDEYQLIEEYVGEHLKTDAFIEKLKESGPCGKILYHKLWHRFKEVHKELNLEMSRFEFLPTLLDKIATVIAKAHDKDPDEKYIKKSCWYVYCDIYHIPKNVETLQTYRKQEKQREKLSAMGNALFGLLNAPPKGQ